MLHAQDKVACAGCSGDVGRRQFTTLRAAAPTILTGTLRFSSSSIPQLLALGIPEARTAAAGSESSISQDGAFSESASTSDPLQLEEYDAANTVYGLQPEDWSHAALSVVVVGASGALPAKLLYDRWHFEAVRS